MKPTTDIITVSPTKFALALHSGKATLAAAHTRAR